MSGTDLKGTRTEWKGTGFQLQGGEAEQNTPLAPLPGFLDGGAFKGFPECYMSLRGSKSTKNAKQNKSTAL